MTKKSLSNYIQYTRKKITTESSPRCKILFLLQIPLKHERTESTSITIKRLKSVTLKPYEITKRITGDMRIMTLRQNTHSMDPN